MTKRSFAMLTWLVPVSVAGLPTTALSQKVGPEFQVNTYTTGDQGKASVALDSAGNFVIVWSDGDYQGNGQDGSFHGVFGQRYDSGGNPLGDEFRVNTYTTGGQTNPTVASDASGNFVVVWNDRARGDSSEVFGQRFDSSGHRLGGEFHVNTYTTLLQFIPSVASSSDGDFVVVWDSGYRLAPGPDGDGWGVSGQRYDSNGTPVGGEFQVNTYTTDDQYLSNVAQTGNGDFVVVWTSGSLFRGPDGSYTGIFGQRYDSNGNPLGGEFQVNSYTTKKQLFPDVAADANGNFVVVWNSLGQDGSGSGIFGQRYDSAGTPLGGEFQVNTYTTYDQEDPSVALDASGNFVVVWESRGQIGIGGQVFGQRYDSAGNPLGGEFQVNTYTRFSQTGPSVASEATGNFVVAWTSYGQDGSSYGVFGQRFSAGCKASLQVVGGVHAPGSSVAIQVHIAHRRPKTVTVAWELRLLDPSGQQVGKHITKPHTFQPGDVVERNLEFRLPNDLVSGTYTLELAISGMAGTNGATKTFRVVRAE